MDDADLGSVRQDFAELTSQFEDAALFASEGQGVNNLDDGRRHLRRITRTMDRIRIRIIALQGRFQ